MTLRQKIYAERLAELKQLIKGKGRTAQELADALSISKPTVYARLDALQDSGTRITLETARQGARGPLATIFRTR